MNSHRETLERFCHVIGKNTPVSKSDTEEGVVYECMNKHICEKNGGCKNSKLCGVNMPVRDKSNSHL